MPLEILTSEAIPLRHGFFTRRGGASSGVFASLNCGFGSSDQKDMVAINRGRVAAALDVPADRVATVYQVHSATALALEAPDPAPRRADAMVTRTPGLLLAVLTADCQPVLFADPRAGVVGAAHAGWRGALDGILEATVAAMVGLGSQPADIRAVIGPSISQGAYEVGPEFLDRFVADDTGNARFFVNGTGDRYLFNLVGFGLARLRAAGVGAAEWIGHCTYADPERFFSYRRSLHRKEADYGRLISAIRL